jgi:hypothetical protein
VSDDRRDPYEGVLVVRRGPGANCSSIGSAVEMLFLSATAGAALLAAVTAALGPGADDDDDDRDPPPESPAVEPET